MAIRFTYLVIAAAAFASGFAYAEGTAHSLDQVPGKLDSPDTRAAYRREMDGPSEADGFGTRLPAGFSKQALIAQLAPGQDPARAVLVGAKPWAQRPNAFVAIVCIAATNDLAKETLQYGPSDRCDGYAYWDSAKTLVWLGVYERDAAGVPRLIARTKEPINKATDWSTTHTYAPDAIGENEKTLHPEEWRGFDLAPYLIRPGDYAFGVRAGWTIGYPSGGASFEALYLFRIDGDELRVIFCAANEFLPQRRRWLGPQRHTTK